MYNSLLLNQNVTLLFFFKTASSVCQLLKVKLQNTALETNSNREGTYSLSSLVNGQPSWTSESCGYGIWYIQDGRRWKIGPLESIGEENGEIESNPLGSELEHPFNMPFKIMDWNYYTENGWMRSNGIEEIVVECIGEEDRQRKGKLLLGLIDIFMRNELCTIFSGIFFCNQFG